MRTKGKEKMLIMLLYLQLISIMTACGTSAKRNLCTPSDKHAYVTISDVHFVFYTDNHKQSRKNADRVFDAWAEASHLKGNITGRRLMSIAPKGKTINLTYDFRMIAGNEQRVTLMIEDYEKTTYKKPKR